MKVKLLKKVRKKFIIIPNNINGRYGFYLVFKKSGLVYDNQAYGSSYAVWYLVPKVFGYIRAYFINRIHEQNKSERKSNTILKRLLKQHK